MPLFDTDIHIFNLPDEEIDTDLEHCDNDDCTLPSKTFKMVCNRLNYIPIFGYVLERQSTSVKHVTDTTTSAALPAGILKASMKTELLLVFHLSTSPQFSLHFFRQVRL